MGNKQVVAEYISEEQLNRITQQQLKKKLKIQIQQLKDLDNEFYTVEWIKSQYKKGGYGFRLCGDNKKLINIFLVRTIYFWYSNMEYTKKQIEYLKKIDKHFNDMDWSYRVWEGDWGELIDLDEGIYKNLLYIECKKIVIKLFYNWYSNSIL